MDSTDEEIINALNVLTQKMCDSNEETKIVEKKFDLGIVSIHALSAHMDQAAAVYRDHKLDVIRLLDRYGDRLRANGIDVDQLRSRYV